MKAYLVREKDQFCATVVFAETAGKAKMLALSTDCCENARFIDIEVHRQPQVDKYYKEGKWHLDWENPQDRIVLVKECGFWCGEEAFEFDDCELCSAKQYCDKYSDITSEYRSDFAREILPINLSLAELL